jgi:hypothetical protein
MAKTNLNLKKDMMQAYVKDVNKLINKKLPKVKFTLADIIFNSVYFSPELDSVRGGTLKYDFGLSYDPTFEISSAVSRSIDVSFSTFKYRNNAIYGNAQIGIQPIDYFNLLEIPGSVTITEKGVELPWLDWLLMYGDSIIIVNYGVKYTEGGRSGGAIMTTENRPFRVDPKYSGTDSDNFITRALNRNSAIIEDRIWQTILN